MKMTEKEMREQLQYDWKYENYLLMPNEIIGMLVNCDALNQKDSPDVAVAYSYTWLITWLYRYAKYGAMEFKDVSVKAIKKLLGLSPTNNTYDYIIKKGGVLDELGITRTLSMTQSPISVWVDKEDDFGYPDFTLFSELDDSTKSLVLKGQTMKKKSFKEPLMATEERTPSNDFDCNGTFYDGGKEFTHLVTFDVFLKCMSNPKLGCQAFYLYSFLQSRIGANDSVGISLEGITTYSGIKPTTRDKFMRELKAFNLIGNDPSDYCMERGEYKTEPSVYWTNDSSQWRYEPNYNFNKRNVYHVSTHIDYVECSTEIKSKKV